MRLISRSCGNIAQVPKARGQYSRVLAVASGAFVACTFLAFIAFVTYFLAFAAYVACVALDGSQTERQTDIGPSNLTYLLPACSYAVILSTLCTLVYVLTAPFLLFKFLTCIRPLSTLLDIGGM